MPYKTEMLQERIAITPSKLEGEDSSKHGKEKNVIVNITVHSNGEQSRMIEVSNFEAYFKPLEKETFQTKESLEEYKFKIEECMQMLNFLKEIATEKLNFK